MLTGTPDFPYGYAVIWDQTGQPLPLPVSGVYAQALADGFNGSDNHPVGIIVFPDNQAAGSPALWNQEGPIFLPVPESYGAPFAGNGQTIVGMVVVSTSVPGESTNQACLWQNGTIQLLNVPGTHFSRAVSINASGVYVGGGLDMSNPNNWVGVGFVGQDGSATRLSYPAFPEAGGVEINDDNWFTGSYQPQNNVRRPFLARAFSDEIYELQMLPGYFEAIAQGINNDRTVVGSIRGSGDWERALIWPNGSPTPVDLNDYVNVPGVMFIQGLDINNAGQILAEGRLHAGGYAYYVLTPVPEPGAAGVVLLTGLRLAWRRRH